MRLNYLPFYSIFNYKDNNKDISKKLSQYLNIVVHTTALKKKAQRNNIIVIIFGIIFFKLMKEKNIDTKSESILH